jgi:STAM-binding protein
MTQHQKSQGYVPSLHSMFNPVMKLPVVPSSLLFEAEPRPQASTSQPYSNPLSSRSLYPTNMLPQPSMPVPPNQAPYPYGPNAQIPQHHSLKQYPYPQAPHSAEPGPSSAPSYPSHGIVAPRMVPTRSADPVTRELKTVNLPKECLPRFLSIAALNTSCNMETCGLLLGKDKERKYVVTTLLIPKQHATSDTCAMDEEELVLQFTEERSLITLGWVGI